MGLLARKALARPAAPMAGIYALTFAATALRLGATDGRLLEVAATVAVLTLAAAALAPWQRLPAWALLAAPVACDAVIGLLRQAQGGSTSGYSPVSVLPVVWVGLVLGRRAVAAITAVTFALFAVPLTFVGAPLYPSSSWRGSILLTVVVCVVGTAANLVVREQSRQTRLASDRARRLARVVETQAAIAAESELDRVMETAVEEALDVTGAAAAVLELPDGADLVYRAVAGTAAPFLGLRLEQATAISGRALQTNDVLLCGDSETDPRVDREACRRVGARSMIVVPLRHDGRATGVLKVYGPEPYAFEPEDAHALELLAGLIAHAIVRAELLERLETHAVTDDLTQLANRRAWYDVLNRSLARGRRSGEPLSVVVLDVDGLKEVNDRLGHAAGDRLLRTAAACWKGALRESDVLGRIGGDEFAVVLEGADETTAAAVVARLARAPPDSRLASAGAATWDGEESVTELVARADAEMYAEKKLRAPRREPLAIG